MTYSRVLIYGNDGTYLAETRARCKRAWLMDDVGDGTLYMPKNDINATDANLRYGNFIFVRNKLVGDWVGVIRTPLSFGNETYEIGLQQAGAILKDRTLHRRIGGTADAVIQDIIAEANAPADLRIRTGQINASQKALLLTDKNSSSLMGVQSVIQKSGMHWSVDPVVGADGRLFVEFNLYDAMGMNLSGSIELHEGQGANIERDDRDPVVQQGEIYNSITVIGKAATDVRISPGIAVDQDSINLYGLREATITENFSHQTAIDNSARSHLAAMAWPQYTINLTAIGSAIFPYIQIGNVLSVRLISIGFSNGKPGFKGRVQIVGKAYDDTEGSMPLTLMSVR